VTTTPEQKRATVERLLDLWLEFPELRLGQLIGNYFRDPDLYYAHDAYLVEELERKYHNIPPVPKKGEILVGHSIIRPIKGLSRLQKKENE
jgi:hypothetical protein